MESHALIGPALPPMFKKKEDDEDSEDETTFSGPALPPGYKRAEPSSSDENEPELSSKRAKTTHTRSDNSAGKTKEPENDEDDGFFGPALPPGFKKQENSPDRQPLLGPALPPGFCRAPYENDADNDDGDADAFLGPALPPGYKADSSSSEDEDVIGPMPSRGPNEDTLALDFERRARRMKEKLTGEDAPEVLTRDTWMTELPPELQHIGLGARTFKKRSGPENKDRSIWTDTPEDRERKAKERLEKKEKGEEEKHEAPQLTQKDLEMAEKVSKYNESKRAESLMNLHAKKMKEKAKEKANTPVERRPFDRDEDLQVNRFDEAQKQRLLKKSQELNTRFSHSKDKMFL
ncbi:GPALPP motifs-containing protein 1 isoform X1 [Takifugu flavidus]|uniref:GPALPP motifs-containing protein 1 isoform X1 n=1 Tax=Takifugu flavidus TaxID=433684 RepID=UPI002543FF60|nr:GPALPP motifs-containing protein 1 isoform X1 [Takifugu flavidus]